MHLVSLYYIKHFCVVKGLEEPTKIVVLFLSRTIIVKSCNIFFFLFLQIVKFFLVTLAVLTQHIFHRQQVVLTLALITEDICFIL